MIKETGESDPVEESSKHMITTVMVDNGWGHPEKMYKLYIKNGDKWYSFRRAYHRPYGLRELQRLAINYNPESGYFCTHGKGNPMEEFKDPLRKLTTIEHLDEYSSFVGNHDQYSGAFSYKIFDRDLAYKISKLLAEERSKW